VTGRDALTKTAWWSLVDPQTSGGLLLAVAAERADAVLDAIQADFPRAARIGVVAPRAGAALQLA